MRLELRHVAPVRAANIGALVYGLLMCAFVLLFLAPFLLLIALMGPSRGFGAGEGITMLIVVMFYPVLGFVMGWVTGLLTAAIYNLVIRWSGGLLLEFDHAAGLSARDVIASTE